MGLGLALVRAANAGGGNALHGPAFAFERGASIQGLKRIAWAARDGSKVRSSGLCFSMHGGVADAPCWIRTNDRLLRSEIFFAGPLIITLLLTPPSGSRLQRAAGSNGPQTPGD